MVPISIPIGIPCRANYGLVWWAQWGIADIRPSKLGPYGPHEQTQHGPRWAETIGPIGGPLSLLSGCDLVVWQVGSIVIFRVYRDDQFIDSFLPQLRDAWVKHIVPLLLTRRISSPSVPSVQPVSTSAMCHMITVFARRTLVVEWLGVTIQIVSTSGFIWSVSKWNVFHARRAGSVVIVLRSVKSNLMTLSQ